VPALDVPRLLREAQECRERLAQERAFGEGGLALGDELERGVLGLVASTKQARGVVGAEDRVDALGVERLARPVQLGELAPVCSCAQK
jgi:hypothetical protein